MHDTQEVSTILTQQEEVLLRRDIQLSGHYTPCDLWPQQQVHQNTSGFLPCEETWGCNIEILPHTRNVGSNLSEWLGLFVIKWDLLLSQTDLDCSCVALQTPNGAATSIEGRLGLGWHGPEADTDPQSLHYLLNEGWTCIWKRLRHQADWEVKGQGHRLQFLGQKRLYVHREVEVKWC